MFGFGRSSSKRDRSPDDGKRRKRDSVSRSSRKPDEDVAASSTTSRRRSRREERKSSDKVSSDGKKSRRKTRDGDSDSESPTPSSRRGPESTAPSTARYDDNTPVARNGSSEPKKSGKSSKSSTDATGDKSVRSSTKRASRSLDQPRASDEPQQSSTSTTSNRITNQFPDQTPLNYSTSLLPGQQSYGAAADYYGDQGQSVAHQPGVRPGTPIIVGAEPHLQPASAEPAPPQETGHGAAADFYAGTDYTEDASYTTAVQSASQSASNQTASAARPPSSQQGHGSSQWATTAVAAGAAGLAATVLGGQHHTSSPRPSTGQALATGSRPPTAQGPTSSPRPPPFQTTSPSSRPPAHTHSGRIEAAQHSNHVHHPQGPLDKFVYWWNDYEDVAKMEAYTEYIGICKHCFDPRSSPADAPRIHRPRRTRSRESLDGVRVDKDRRYRATDSSKRRQKRDASWLGASLAGLGLAGAAKAVDGHASDSDESTELAIERNASSSQAVAAPRVPGSRVDAESASRRTSATTKLQNTSVLGQSSPRVRAESGSARTSAKERTAEIRSDRPTFPSAPNQYPRPDAAETRPAAAQRRQSSSSESEQDQGLLSRFFGTPQKKGRRPSRNSGAVYHHSNSSSSSVDSSLAFGPGRGRPAVPSKRPSAKRRSSSDAARNALLGLGAAAAALAAHDARRGKRGAGAKDVLADRPRLGGQERPIRQAHQGPVYSGSDEEAWESASNDSQSSSNEHHGLAFGDDVGGNGIVMTDAEAEEGTDGDEWTGPVEAGARKASRHDIEGSRIFQSPSGISPDRPVFRPSDIEISAPQSRRPIDTRRLPDLGTAPLSKDNSSPVGERDTPKKLSRATTFPLNGQRASEQAESFGASPSSKRSKKTVGFAAVAAAAATAATVAAASSPPSARKESPPYPRPAREDSGRTKKTYTGDEDHGYNDRLEDDDSDRPGSPRSARFQTQIRRPPQVEHNESPSEDDLGRTSSAQPPSYEPHMARSDSPDIATSGPATLDSPPGRAVPRVIEPRSPSPTQRSSAPPNIPRIEIIEPSRTPTPEPIVRHVPRISIDGPDSSPTSEDKADDHQERTSEESPVSNSFRVASAVPENPFPDSASTVVRADHETDDSRQNERSFRTEIRRPGDATTAEDMEPVAISAVGSEAEEEEPEPPAHSDDYASWEADRASFRPWQKRAASEQNAQSPKEDVVGPQYASGRSNGNRISKSDRKPSAPPEEASKDEDAPEKVSQSRDETNSISKERQAAFPSSGGSTKFASFVSALQQSAKADGTPKQSQRQASSPPHKPGPEQLFKFPDYDEDSPENQRRFTDPRHEQQPKIPQDVPRETVETAFESSGEHSGAPLPNPRPSSPVFPGDETSDRYALPPSESRLSSPVEAIESTPDATPARGPRPSRTPSSTSIPLRFRPPKFSPASNRDSSVQSPNGSESSPTHTPVRPRSARPSSTEFKSSTDFRPLYLVERNRRILEPEVPLPSLPSSRSTSRSPSVQDSEDAFESAVESPDLGPTASDVPLPDSPGSRDIHEDPDFLDSGQTTPKAGRVSQSPPRHRASGAMLASIAAGLAATASAQQSHQREPDTAARELPPLESGSGFSALSDLSEAKSQDLGTPSEAHEDRPGPQGLGAEDALNTAAENQFQQVEETLPQAEQDSQPFVSRPSKTKKKKQAKKGRKLSLASEQSQDDDAASSSPILEANADTTRDLMTSPAAASSTVEDQPSEAVPEEQEASGIRGGNQQIDDNLDKREADFERDGSSRADDAADLKEAEQGGVAKKMTKKERRKSKKLSWAEPLSAPEVQPVDPESAEPNVQESVSKSFNEPIPPPPEGEQGRSEPEPEPAQDPSSAAKTTKKEKRKSKKANKSALGWSSIFSAVTDRSASKSSQPAEADEDVDFRDETRNIGEIESLPPIESSPVDKDHGRSSSFSQTTSMDESEPPLTATRGSFPELERVAPEDLNQETSQNVAKTLPSGFQDNDKHFETGSVLPSSDRRLHTSNGSDDNRREGSSEGTALTNEATAHFLEEASPESVPSGSKELDLEPYAESEIDPSPTHPRGIVNLPDASNKDIPSSQSPKLDSERYSTPAHPLTLLKLPNNFDRDVQSVMPEKAHDEDPISAPTHPLNILNLPDVLDQDHQSTQTNVSVDRKTHVAPTHPQSLASLPNKYEDDPHVIHMGVSDARKDLPAPTRPEHVLKLPNSLGDNAQRTGADGLFASSLRDDSPVLGNTRHASPSEEARRSKDAGKPKVDASFDDVVTATMAAAGFSAAMLSNMPSQKTGRASPARAERDSVDMDSAKASTPRAESPKSPSQSSPTRSDKKDAGFDEIVAAAMATAGFHEGMLSRRSSQGASSMVSAREEPESHDVDRDIFSTPRAGSPSYAWAGNDGANVGKETQSPNQPDSEVMPEPATYPPDSEWSSTSSKKQKGKKGKTPKASQDLPSSDILAAKLDDESASTAAPQDDLPVADESAPDPVEDGSRARSEVDTFDTPNKPSPSVGSAETDSGSQNFSTSGKKKKEKRKSSSSKTSSLFQFFSGSSKKQAPRKTDATLPKETSSSATGANDGEEEVEPAVHETGGQSVALGSSDQPQNADDDTASNRGLPQKLDNAPIHLDLSPTGKDLEKFVPPAPTTPVDVDNDGPHTPGDWDVPMSSKEKKKKKKADKAKRASAKSEERTLPTSEGTGTENADAAADQVDDVFKYQIMDDDPVENVHVDHAKPTEEDPAEPIDDVFKYQIFDDGPVDNAPDQTHFDGNIPDSTVDKNTADTVTQEEGGNVAVAPKTASAPSPADKTNEDTVVDDNADEGTFARNKTRLEGDESVSQVRQVETPADVDSFGDALDQDKELDWAAPMSSKEKKKLKKAQKAAQTRATNVGSQDSAFEPLERNLLPAAEAADGQTEKDQMIVPPVPSRKEDEAAVSEIEKGEMFTAPAAAPEEEDWAVPMSSKDKKKSKKAKRASKVLESDLKTVGNASAPFEVATAALLATEAADVTSRKDDLKMEPTIAPQEDDWTASISGKDRKKSKKAQKAQQALDSEVQTNDEAPAAPDAVSFPTEATDVMERNEPEPSIPPEEDEWAVPVSGKEKKKSKKAQKASKMRDSKDESEVTSSLALLPSETTPLVAETEKSMTEDDETQAMAATSPGDEWTLPINSEEEEKMSKKAQGASKLRSFEDETAQRSLPSESMPIVIESPRDMAEDDGMQTMPVVAPEDEWAAPMSSKQKKKAKKAQKARKGQDDADVKRTSTTGSVEPASLPAEAMGDPVAPDEVDVERVGIDSIEPTSLPADAIGDPAERDAMADEPTSTSNPAAASGGTGGQGDMDVERAVKTDLAEPASLPSGGNGNAAERDGMDVEPASLLKSIASTSLPAEAIGDAAKGDGVDVEPAGTSKSIEPTSLPGKAVGETAEADESRRSSAAMAEDDWAFPSSSKGKKKGKKGQKATRVQEDTAAVEREETTPDAPVEVDAAAAGNDETQATPTAAPDDDEWALPMSSKEKKKKKKAQKGSKSIDTAGADNSMVNAAGTVAGVAAVAALASVGEGRESRRDSVADATPTLPQRALAEKEEEQGQSNKKGKKNKKKKKGMSLSWEDNAESSLPQSGNKQGEEQAETANGTIPAQGGERDLADAVMEEVNTAGAADGAKDLVGPRNVEETRERPPAREEDGGHDAAEVAARSTPSEEQVKADETEQGPDRSIFGEAEAAMPGQVEEAREQAVSHEATDRRGRSLEAIPETSREASLMQSLAVQEEGDVAEAMDMDKATNSPPVSHAGLTRSAIGKLDEEEASIGLPDAPLHPDDSRSEMGSRRGEGSEVMANIRRAYIRAPGQEQREATIRPSSAQSSHSRAASATSNQSGSLRKVDRSVSSDLRAANKRDAALAASGKAHAATSVAHQPDLPPPNYEPLKGTGKDRRQDMSDTGVFEAWGDARGSPRSPTKPPSIRKRQSTQILELEAQLDEVRAENRSLHDARSRTPQPYGSPDLSASLQKTLQSRDVELRDKDVEIESIRSSLATLRAEIARLTEHNGQLQEANENLSADVNARYATLQSERDQAHSQWQESSRQLASLTERHDHLSTGMEAIVQEQIGAALAEKKAEISDLRAELDEATDRIVALQQQIQAAGAGPQDDFLNVRDEDYFDGACQQLCQHVQQWVLRFSKFSDTKTCRLSSQLDDDATETRLDNAILDGSDVDTYLADRVKRRDVFMSIVMTMIWEFVFTRYLFGMDREQRQKLKSLEKTLGEVGPQRAVAQWRATTLTLLSRREAFQEQRAQDTEAVCQEIYTTLERLLPPPQRLAQQIQESLRNVLSLAVDVSIEMRTQRPEYVMLPPLQPEYDTNGDLARKVYFNAALMNERSGETASNEELEERSEVVRVVLFPLVVKKGNDAGETDEEVVVCPAQVLVARPDHPQDRARLAGGGPMGRSVQSLAPSMAPSAAPPFDAGSMV